MKDKQKQVADFLEKLDHPLKPEIEEVRKIIRQADGSLTEHIKWNAPSFCHNGDDRITFNLQGKGFFRLIFHCGAKVKANKPQTRLFADTTGLLDWQDTDRAVAKFTDMQDVEAKKEALMKTIQTWVKLTDKYQYNNSPFPKAC
jgi:hypothetical protein